MLFICPKCKEKLNMEEGRAFCKSGHSFDKSRYGYYNLLLDSSRKIHGDSKSMVEARRAFLSRGFYRPLAEQVATLVTEYTAPDGRLLDAGCGEGYYTDIVEQALYSRDGKSSVYAFDISKDAVREAGKKNPRVSLAVAGSYHMPIASESVDTVINTFSPLARDEVHRVLKSGGIFIMAIPDKEHLYDLKSAIYDTPYKNEVSDTALEGFELIADVPLSYVMQLSSKEDIRALFEMTPYAYRTKPENKDRVYRLDRLNCLAAFRIFVYRRL